MAQQPVRLGHPKEHPMRRIYFCFLILTVLGLNLIPSRQDQGSPGRKAAMASATPTPGFRAEFLEEVTY